MLGFPFINNTFGRDDGLLEVLFVVVRSYFDELARVCTLHQLKTASKTRVHCSPPSIADIYAAAHVLSINQSEGEQRLIKAKVSSVRSMPI